MTAYLAGAGHSVDVLAEEAAWPEVGRRSARRWPAGHADRGVVCCWTGTGVSIAANKVPGSAGRPLRGRRDGAGRPAMERRQRRWPSASGLTSEQVATEILDAFFATEPGSRARRAPSPSSIDAAAVSDGGRPPRRGQSRGGVPASPTDRHVRANFVVSIDGMVEVGGRSSPLGGPADRAAFMAMRAVTDAILVGAGTVRAENYGPVRLERAATERRLARGQAPSRRWRSSAIGPTCRPTRPGVHRRAEAAPADLGAAAAAARDDLAVTWPRWWFAATKHVDLTLALDALRARGLGRVLCEGGPTLLRVSA